MTHLNIGDKAPHFSGIIQDNTSVSLEDYKGSKLVLYFYPKDNTPGCTTQACNLSDNYDALLAKGYKVLGVSPDSVRKHVNFIKKFNLPFDLLADTEKETILAYGVWGPKKFMGKEYEGIHRTTFIIDEEGTIIDIIKKVKTKEHTKQIIGEE